MIREMTHFSPSMNGFSPSSYLFSPVLTESLQPSPWSNHHHHHVGLSSPPEPAVPGYDDPPSSQLTLEAAAFPPQSLAADLNSTTASPKKKARKSNKSTYKHVPHREKPPHLVARRNARERRRVQAVNTAFSRLRKCVPVENRNKRLSKVKTLHRAIEYIQTLQEMLERADDELTSTDPSLNGLDDFIDGEVNSLNKENEVNQRWVPLSTTSWDHENQSSCLSFYDDFVDQLHS